MMMTLERQKLILQHTGLRGLEKILVS
ncbi:protein of unknown function [Magnetospirillum sp. XM-1]|nr:protein of unknown function [Magnetospirillum sp. XM-1]